MDRITNYRELVKQQLTQVATYLTGSRSGDVETQCVFDDEHDQYLLLRTGWNAGRRIRGTTLHIRLRNDKISIEEDMTEEGIANAFLEAGVPREDIVLAFHPPQSRHLTDFAPA